MNVTAILPTAWQQKLHRKRLAYVRTFCDDQGHVHPEAVRVLADLRRLCRMDDGGLVISPVARTVDAHATMYRAGLRDVYLRITRMLNYDEVPDERSPE